MAEVKSALPVTLYFGGKSAVADLVWQRLGDPLNFVDPFCGSASFLWKRPYWDVETAQFTTGRPYRTETINELNPFIANFYRAVHHDPEQVAHYADWPVSECDLHARHLWLIGQSDFRERMLTDPDYFDAKIAGWWVWGACAWIGSGWCDVSMATGNGKVATKDGRMLPQLVNSGGMGLQTVRRQRPQLRPAQGVQAMRPPSRQLPNFGKGGTGQGINASRYHGGGVLSFILALSDRLRNVRVTCGDWSRVTGKSVTYKIGMTGIVLDPPYNVDAERAAGLYAYDDLEVSTAVRAYALENGDNPKMRIALFGYFREHGPHMPDSWECLRWTTGGGYSNQNKEGNDNPEQECIWFSPHCIKPKTNKQLALL